MGEPISFCHEKGPTLRVIRWFEARRNNAGSHGRVHRYAKPRRDANFLAGVSPTFATFASFAVQ